MKDTSLVASRRAAYDRTNRWPRSGTAEVGSSVESSAAEEEDDDEQSSDGNLLLTLDASDSRMSIEDLCGSIVKNEVDVGETVDDGAEPGKFNFQLLPGHCVNGRQGNKMYKCDICGGIYRHAFSLKRHYLRTHINYSYLSRSDVANCNINIEAHVSHRDRTDSEITAAAVLASLCGDVYRCHICNLHFEEALHLKDHILNHPNTPSSKRFNCTQCDMTFSHKQNLVRHMSVHSGEKPYPCKHCGKGFPTATNQRRHERIHQGLKPYLCPHCQSHFSQSGDLKKHIRKLHREFFHPCAFCMKYFAHRTELQEHVVSHGKSLEHNHRVLSRKMESNGSCGGGSGSSSSSSSSSGGTGNIAISVVNARQTDVDRPSLLVVPCSFPRLASSDLPRRYRCNVCEKRFYTSVNLQRHRSIAHPQRRSDPRKTTLTVPRRITRRSPETIQLFEGNRLSEPSPYFANVSQNIAHNLQHYLDGKLKPQNNHFGGGGGEVGKLGDDVASPKHRISTVGMSWGDYGYGTREDVVSNGYVEPFRELSGSCWLVSDLPSSEEEDSSAVGNGTSSYKEAGVVLDLSVSKVSVISEGDVDGLSFKPPKSMFLCHACGECFASLVEIEDHKVNNHPNVHCTHVEVDNLKDVPLDILRFHCSPEGALQRCPLVPTVCSVANAFKPRCTKCREMFETSGELHEHILVCGGHVDKRNVVGGIKLRDFSKRVGKRGMKRRHDTSEDSIFPKRRSGLKLRRTKRDPGFDWLPTEQQDWKIADRSTPFCTLSASSSALSHTSSKSNDLHLMCDGCNQKFKYVSALERHRRCCLPEVLHRGQKAREMQLEQHSCPYCSRSFTYTASLKKHVAESCPQKDTAEAKEKRALNKIANQKNKKVQQSEKLVTPAKKQVAACSTLRVISTRKVLDAGGEKESSYKEDDDDEPVEQTVEPVAAIKKAAIKEEVAEEHSASLALAPVAVRDDDNTSPKKIASPVPCEVSKPAKRTSTTEGEATADKSAAPTLATSGGSGAEPSTQTCMRQEQHTCPNCKRTFTYLANYKKHLNVLCPLRALKTDGEGGGGGAGMSGADKGSNQTKTDVPADSDSEEKVDDPESVAEASTEPKSSESADSHKCSICHKSFTEYVEMLKHRLLHKLKTTIGGGGGVGLKIDRNRIGRSAPLVSSPPPPSFDDVSGDRLHEVISAHRKRTGSASSCGSSDEPLAQKRDLCRETFALGSETNTTVSESVAQRRLDLVLVNRFHSEDSEDVDDDFGIEVSKIFTSNSALVDSNVDGNSDVRASSSPTSLPMSSSNATNDSVTATVNAPTCSTQLESGAYSSVVVVDGTSNSGPQDIVLTLL